MGSIITHDSRLVRMLHALPIMGCFSGVSTSCQWKRSSAVTRNSLLLIRESRLTCLAHVLGDPVAPMRPFSGEAHLHHIILTAWLLSPKKTTPPCIAANGGFFPRTHSFKVLTRTRGRSSEKTKSKKREMTAN